MINDTYKTMIALIKSALYKTKTVLPENFNWGIAEKITRRHEIYGLIYVGLLNSGIDAPKWLGIGFLNQVILLTRLWQKADEICKAFDESGVEYMPLKGIAIKEKYPEPYVRFMGDVDILIHTEDYETKIKPIMEKFGYAADEETDHELKWIKEGQTIELHKRIIPSNNKDFYNIIKDGWDWLKNNDKYVYLLTHFAKHYRDSGVRIGQLVDLELCRSDKCGRSIEELHLTRFNENVQKTLDCWFRDKEFDEVSAFITERIFNNTYETQIATSRRAGSMKAIRAAGGSVKRARIKRLLISVFPPYSFMKEKYKVLKRVPILLPLFWGWRIICAPFGGNVKKCFASSKEIAADNYQKELEYVGLDFWF